MLLRHYCWCGRSLRQDKIDTSRKWRNPFVIAIDKRFCAEVMLLITRAWKAKRHVWSGDILRHRTPTTHNTMHWTVVKARMRLQLGWRQRFMCSMHPHTGLQQQVYLTDAEQTTRRDDITSRLSSPSKRPDRPVSSVPKRKLTIKPTGMLFNKTTECKTVYT